MRVVQSSKHKEADSCIHGLHANQAVAVADIA